MGLADSAKKWGGEGLLPARMSPAGAARGAIALLGAWRPGPRLPRSQWCLPRSVGGRSPEFEMLASVSWSAFLHSPCFTTVRLGFICNYCI